jgi:2,4-dienoyl-CoA reductase-like NADH-dependent reductase (Old Yellow Enzyme family)
VHLLGLLKVGRLTFKNRIIATPGSPALDCQSTIAFYENNARGGATCVTPGEHAVSSKYPL